MSAVPEAKLPSSVEEAKSDTAAVRSVSEKLQSSARPEAKKIQPWKAMSSLEESEYPDYRGDNYREHSPGADSGASVSKPKDRYIKTQDTAKATPTAATASAEAAALQK